MMGANAGDTVVLRSFAEEKIQSVELLGHGSVPFHQEHNVLVVQLPDKLPSICANTLKIR
jgi:hypothetical protein